MGCRPLRLCHWDCLHMHQYTMSAASNAILRPEPDCNAIVTSMLQLHAPQLTAHPVPSLSHLPTTRKQHHRCMSKHQDHIAVSCRWITHSWRQSHRKSMPMGTGEGPSRHGSSLQHGSLVGLASRAKGAPDPCQSQHLARAWSLGLSSLHCLAASQALLSDVGFPEQPLLE